MKNLEKIIKIIKENHKVMAIYLYGSYATGKEKPISDVDIAVILKDPSKEDEAEIGSLYSDKIDLVLFHRLPVYIQYEVFKYGKKIFVRDEEYVLDVKLKVLREYLEYVRMYEYFKKEVFK